MHDEGGAKPRNLPISYLLPPAPGKGEHPKPRRGVCQHYGYTGDLTITDLLELEICSFVGHSFVSRAELTLWGTWNRMHVLRIGHPEAVAHRRLFSLRSRRGRRMTCGRLGEFCLGDGVAEVGILGGHGIQRKDA